jgi:hypothetical protein
VLDQQSTPIECPALNKAIAEVGFTQCAMPLRQDHVISTVFIIEDEREYRVGEIMIRFTDIALLMELMIGANDSLINKSIPLK